MSNMDVSRTLSQEEKGELASLLSSDRPIVILLHGEDLNRTLSFYAEGTRREVRIGYPRVEG